MTRRRLCLLVLTLTIALVAATHLFSKLEPSRSSLEVVLGATPHQLTNAKGYMEEPASLQLAPRDPDAERAGVVAIEDQATDRAAFKPLEAETMARGLETAPEPKSLDDSVAGQPFPVSESILTACKKARWDGTCELGRPLLKKFAEEPREEPWAIASERAIRALIELEPGTDRPRALTYTIRNLECRKTICFVETASHMERFSTQFVYFEIDNELNAGYSMSSREIKDDGTTVYVTLLPVVRRGAESDPFLRR